MIDPYMTDLMDKKDRPKTKKAPRDPNYVSPLEVVGSMAGKVVRKIEDGFLGSMARGILKEQAYTSFGKSGSDFAKKNFTYGRGIFSYEVGCLAGIFWDIGCAGNMIDYARGCKLSDYDTVGAIYGATKVATQLGAYAMRHYQDEKNRLIEQKTKGVKK